VLRSARNVPIMSHSLARLTVAPVPVELSRENQNFPAHSPHISTDRPPAGTESWRQAVSSNKAGWTASWSQSGGDWWDSIRSRITAARASLDGGV